MTKVTINSELCDGHGRCVELVPAVFVLDADGFGSVRADSGDADRALLERAAALCPTLAITLADG